MRIPNQITTICASKYYNVEDMKRLYSQDIKHFGENRTDVFLTKYKSLKETPITWHFIGHLQRNKAKDVIPFIDYLHTLDSLKLAKVIQKTRIQPLKCFIQVNATEEPQKYGVFLKDVTSFYNELKKYDKIQVVGLMTMGKLDDEDETRRAFHACSKLNQSLSLPFLSMGMTDDYQIAIEEGTTHLRLGRYFKQFLEG